MDFLVLIGFLVLLSVFAGLQIQVRHMAIDGKPVLGVIPRFLAARMSDTAYNVASFLFAWLFVVVGGVIKEAKSVDDFWALVYSLVLAGLFAFFWLKNRYSDIIKI
jgi:hypothetical protein